MIGIGGATNQALPSYGAGVSFPYLASRNVGNFTAKSTARTRADIAVLEGGGSADWVAWGDSLMWGFNGVGSTNDPELSYPANIVKFLAASGTGIVDGGGGWRPFVTDELADTAPGFSKTGGFGAAGFPFFFTNTGGTITQITRRACTSVGICYNQLSGNNIPWTVDGAAQAVLTSNGTNTWKQVIVPGFPNAIHTIVASPAAVMYADGYFEGNASGLRVHNMGFGGACLNAGNTLENLSDFSAPSNLAGARLGLVPATGVHAVFIQGGGNDVHKAANPATIVQGYANIMAQAPFANADLYIITSWQNPADTVAAYNAFLSAAYQKVTGLNATIIDWNDRVQGRAAAQANGMLGPDNVHGNYSTYIGFGKSIGDLLLD